MLASTPYQSPGTFSAQFRTAFACVRMQEVVALDGRDIIRMMRGFTYDSDELTQFFPFLDWSLG